MCTESYMKCSLCVILPGHDAADVWDEPLGGVESQNSNTMVALQPQLETYNVPLLTQWHSASITFDLHLVLARRLMMRLENGHETRDVTQAVNFTHPSVGFQQPILTLWKCEYTFWSTDYKIGTSRSSCVTCKILSIVNVIKITGGVNIKATCVWGNVRILLTDPKRLKN